MTEQDFNALVAELDAQARRDPAAYRRRVAALALLGDAYLAAVLLLVGALASIAWLKFPAPELVFAIAPCLWLLQKAIWLGMPPPAGEEIRPAQAPELFAAVDRLRRRLDAPAVHRILVTDQLNAAIVQTPRLGFLGWPRNDLLLGLPLMKCLSPAQFEAVLAHELGHLAGGHGRLANWIHRRRQRWSRLLGFLEATRSRGGFVVRPFLDWYAPFFNAYSFPLARANEYEADRAASRLVSPAATAEALTAIGVIGRYLGERFWPDIHRQADDLPQPAFAPYSGFSHRLAADVDEAAGRRWLAEAMARPTPCGDTHPALAERLAAIGRPPHLALPAPGQGAERLLGTALEAITGALDRHWEAGILPAWRERHREVQGGRRRLAELDGRLAGGAELSLQDAYDRARLTESAGTRADVALELFRNLHRRAPDDPAVCIALGARLLSRDDDGGQALIERAMALDENLILQGCELLRDHFWRRGRQNEAHAWHQRLTARAAAQRAAELERGSVYLGDRFEHHGLAAARLLDLKSQLLAVPGLHRAYLARKRVKHLPHRPCYVLGVGGASPPHDRKRAAEVLQHIQERVRLPGETVIVNIDGNRFGRKFRWLWGSRLV